MESSPIKQIWLPLDFEWINSQNGETGFATAYKKKYNIDLNNFFEVYHDTSEDSYRISIKAKVAIGAYSEDTFEYGSSPFKGYIVQNDAVLRGSSYVYNSQSSTDVDLLIVGLYENSNDFAEINGFGLYTAKNSRPATLDDLKIRLVVV